MADAVELNQNHLIDREVRGSSTTGGGGAVPLGAFSTGRVRASDHDGLNGQLLVPASPGRDDLNDKVRGRSYSFKTDEASAFANGVVAIPGTVLGGQVKLSAFVGHNWLWLEVKSNAIKVLDQNQFGSAVNNSVIAGGTALWAKQNTYALASIVGMWGETRISDSIDDCDPVGCALDRLKYGTTGLIGTLTAGHVFPLSSAPSGPKLDLRGSISYLRNDGDRFLNEHGDQYKINLSTWVGKAGVTLYGDVALPNNALVRPYLSAYVRQEWGYRNIAEFIEFGSGERTVTNYEQDHTHGGLDAGLTYAIGNMTLSAAMYYELSGDEHTLGSRLGASWKFGGEAAQRESARAAPTSPFSWTGFYFGANAGAGWSSTDMTNLGPEIFFDAPVGASDRLASRGMLGGGQIGYNIQMGTVVVGLEGMWNASKLKDDNSSTFSLNDTWIAEISQLYSITGRLGIVNGNWMPYVKGGFAGARVTSSMTRPADVPFISQATEWHAGWTVGVGTEYAFDRSWTVGVGYDYYSFGSKDVSAVRTGDPAIGGGGIDHWRVNPGYVQSLTARMNFKLN
jgi:outer membrane immunogenic protein